jgi:hypothetical protein
MSNLSIGLAVTLTHFLEFELNFTLPKPGKARIITTRDGSGRIIASKVVEPLSSLILFLSHFASNLCDQIRDSATNFANSFTGP